MCRISVGIYLIWYPIYPLVVTIDVHLLIAETIPVATVRTLPGYSIAWHSPYIFIHAFLADWKATPASPAEQKLLPTAVAHRLSGSTFYQTLAETRRAYSFWETLSLSYWLASCKGPDTETDDGWGHVCTRRYAAWRSPRLLFGSIQIKPENF